VGYDIVGIVHSGEHRGDGSVFSDFPANEDMTVGEKWARRAIGIESLTLEPARLRDASSAFPSGITAVCAVVEGLPVGMVATSFGVVSVEPGLASVCIRRGSARWNVLRERPRLGLSLLSQSQGSTCRRLSLTDGDAFAGVDWRAEPNGAVLVHDATLWLDCSIHSEVHAGDHLIVLFELHGLWVSPETPPLVWQGRRFRQLDAS
jgi:flavin reductase (DIM6/NTAB) family NADH-FMN oxidoreductase RutF